MNILTKQLFLITICTLSALMNAMEKNALSLPKLTPQEKEQLGNLYEEYAEAESPRKLRKAYIGIVTALAYKPSSQRDKDIVENAQKVHARISEKYTSKEAEKLFLYGLPLVLEPQEEKDRYPFRQFYTPVETARKMIIDNQAKATQYQSEILALASKESYLQAEHDALQKKLQLTKDKLRKTQECKELKTVEKSVIADIEKAFRAYIIGQGVTLEQAKQKRVNTAFTLINQFLALGKDPTKKEERTKLEEQINQTIDQLACAEHYIKRIKSEDGSLTTAENLRWKTNMYNPEELGITNYQEYLQNK